MLNQHRTLCQPTMAMTMLKLTTRSTKQLMVQCRRSRTQEVRHLRWARAVQRHLSLVLPLVLPGGNLPLLRSSPPSTYGMALPSSQLPSSYKGEHASLFSEVLSPAYFRDDACLSSKSLRRTKEATQKSSLVLSAPLIHHVCKYAPPFGCNACTCTYTFEHAFLILKPLPHPFSSPPPPPLLNQHRTLCQSTLVLTMLKLTTRSTKKTTVQCRCSRAQKVRRNPNPNPQYIGTCLSFSPLYFGEDTALFF